MKRWLAALLLGWSVLAGAESWHFGLIGDVENLSAMRRARARGMGSTPYQRYTDTETIARELDESLRLFRARGWRWIDISGRAVEENASKILELVRGYTAFTA